MSPKRRLCVVIPTWWNLLCWRRLIEPQILRTVGWARRSGDVPAIGLIGDPQSWLSSGMPDSGLWEFALARRSFVVFGLRFRFYGLI